MIISKAKDNRHTTEITISDNKTVRPVYAGQPIENGGLGTDFRPAQLVLAGYLSCLSINVRHFLNEDNIPYEDVIITGDFDSSDEDLTKIYTKIEIIADISKEEKDRYIAMASSCHVGRILSSKKEFLPLD